jgi:transcriptional regulator with XRE-family HTH domain
MPAKPKPPQSLPASDDVRGILGYNLRLLRVARGWSQESLAHASDLDRSYVSGVERSHWNVSLGNIERFAVALETEPWRLLKPPDEPPKACLDPCAETP